MRVLQGTGVSPGVNAGKPINIERTLDFSIAATISLDEGIKELTEKYKSIIEKYNSSSREIEAEVLEAYILILNDPELTNSLSELNETNLEQIYDVFLKQSEVFKQMDDEYFQQRSEDIEAIGKELIFTLQDISIEFDADVPQVIFANELTPNETSSMNLNLVKGFVVEADEYDSAFFDKRSKFIHYSSRTLVLNNLEFDHADIFENLEAIEKQFHHLIRTVPGNGLIIFPYNDAAIDKVLGMGCWTPRQQFEINVPTKNCQQHAENAGIFWNVELNNDHGSEFQLVKYEKKRNGEETVNSYSLCWSQTGLHNVKNALASLVAAHHVGVDVPTAIAALSEFSGVKRRMELRGEVKGIKIYDDFAHHPTAIKMTLNGIAARLQSDSGPSRLIAVIEPRSATMKLGIHQKELNDSCYAADIVLWYRPKDAKLDIEALVSASDGASFIFDSVDEIVSHLKGLCLPGDNVVIMSNGGFEGIHDKVLRALG